ncbi:MAG: phosphate uptake regulator PhoU [archaeon]|nr:phosphate uptake regulator PhoU [archaeon]
MEVRKLQTTAAGTFIITIPKVWAEKLRFKKGDLVSLELEQGDIVVTPTKSRPASQSRSLAIDEFKDQKLLELCITASYIQGHDVTEVISKEKILPDQKRWVRHAVEGLIGVEIAEDYANRIVLQNLVDPSRFEMDKLLERFTETSKAVFEDAIKAFIENDFALAEDAFERGEESTKLYRLLMRLALQAARNKKIREEMNLGDFSTVAVKIIAIRELGRMAYYAMRIAQHVGEIDDKLDESILSLIQKMTKITLEMEDQAFTALSKKDLALASSVIDRMTNIRKLYETAHSASLKEHNDRTSLALSLIIRDIRAIAGYTVALADDAVLGIFA